MRKSLKIVVIGSTGKLGSRLLNFSKKNDIDIYAATCFKNSYKLNSQKNKYSIKNTFVLSDENENSNFLKFLKNKIDIIYFLDFGSNSLIYLDHFLKNNKNSTIAIANKEMIIAGGKIIFKRIKKSNCRFISLDSEHFSLKNNLLSNNIKKIFITASGGPFYFSKLKSFKKVNLKQVLSHPKWKMGTNNLIDSSNFMNKILEIFELSYIYDIPMEKLDFVISKNAFIHSIILYDDGIISFNCFKNDMLIALIYPLTSNGIVKNYISSEPYIFNEKNLMLKNNFDKRFNFFKYYKKMIQFDHSRQILMMLLNNYAQSLYLNNRLQYHEIVPFIMKRLNNMDTKTSLTSLSKIVDFINNFKSKNQYE